MPTKWATLVDSGSTTGTGSPATLDPKVFMPNLRSGLVIVFALKAVSNNSFSFSNSDWTIADTGSGGAAWDVGQPGEAWAIGYLQPWLTQNPLSITWSADSAPWIMAAACYESDKVTANSSAAGFDAYTYPSLSTSQIIYSGSALVHVKTGDHNSGEGACGLDTGFSNVLNVSNAGSGLIDIQQRLGYNSTSFTGGSVGANKGVGVLFALAPKTIKSKARKFRR